MNYPWLFRARRLWLLGLMGGFGSFGLRAQAPAITAPPLSQAAVVGQAVSMAVTATGAEPLSYQWKRNGQTVAGATDRTFGWSPTSLSDAGFYEVVVSDAQGSTTARCRLLVGIEGAAIAAWGMNDAGQTNVPAGLGNVVAVAGGVRHSLVLRADGTVAAWGESSYGKTTVPVGLTGVVAISAGANHNLVLKSDGTVVAWGDDFGGKATVPAGLNKVVAIAAGWDHNLVLKSDGTVVAWGFASNGDTTVPAGLNNVVAVAAGVSQSYALKVDGTITAWGGDFGIPETVPAGLASVVAMDTRGSASGNHTLALKADGTVVGWGYNAYGQATVPSGLNGVIAVAAGANHSLALRADGTLFGWGSNDTGQTSVPAGLTGVTSVAAGYAHTLALFPATPPSITVPPLAQTVNVGTTVRLSVTATGTPPLAYRWKRNGTTLADGGSITGATSATLVIASAQIADSGSYAVEISNAAGTVTSSAAALAVVEPPTITVRPLSRIAMVGQALSFSVGAQGGEPLAYQWKRKGQVIAGATGATLSLASVALTDRGCYEVQVTNTAGGTARSVFYLDVGISNPSVVALSDGAVPGGLGNVVAVDANGSSGLALRVDGTVVGWGQDDSGQVRIPAGTNNVVAVALGISHSVLLKGDGTVVQLGVAWDASYTPPAGLNNVVAVSSNRYGTLALKADGTVVGWGFNNSQEFSIPAGLADVVGIAAGFGHGLALKSDGTVVSWGNYRALPAGLADVAVIAADRWGFSNLALKNDGTVIKWDANSGQIGAVPAGLSNVIAISIGDLALKADGTVVGWNAYTALPLGLSQVVAVSGGGYAITATNIPAIVTPPVGQIVTVGGYASFSVTATGTIPLSFQWRRNGVNLSNGGRISGATTPTLMVNGVTTEDAGNYSVVVSNGVGLTTSADAVLTVTVAPVITARPASQIVTVGQPVVLSVTAADPGPVSYQWKRNGEPIAGATAATFGVAGATLADRGYYEVVVSNAVAASRSVFMLNVSSAPVSTPRVVAWGDNPYRATLVPTGLGNVVGVACGDNHGVALRAGGTVLAWGLPNYGQLMIPAGLSEVVAVAAGSYHTLVLKADGTVASWGSYAGTPPAVPGDLRDVVQISARATHNLALRSDGTVVSWGGPVLPSGLTSVKAVAAGAYHGLALKRDGLVVGWGNNSDGQTSVPAGLAAVTAVAAGARHSVALRSDGTVVAWGKNDYGQCAVPTGLAEVVAIAAGDSHTAVINSDGTVVIWGENAPNPPSPLQAIAIAAGGGFDLAIAGAKAPVVVSAPASRYANLGEDVTLSVVAAGVPFPAYQWSKDGNALAGATSSTLVLTGVQTANNGSYAVTVSNEWGTTTTNAATLTVVPPATIAARPLTKRVFLGDAVALTVGPGDAGVNTFQWKRNGQVITGATAATYSLATATLADNGYYEVQVTNSAGGTARSYCWLHVTSRYGEVIAWGYNADQQCAVPASLGPVVAVVASGTSSAALLATGTVTKWGGMSSWLTPPVGLSGVVSLATSDQHMLALLSDGTVTAWGQNYSGEATVPAGLRDVIAVAAGNYFSVALKADGTLVGWGTATAGWPQLKNIVGLSVRAYQSVFLRSDGRVVNGSNEFLRPNTGLTAIAAGLSHALALRSDGTIVSWGSTSYGLQTLPANATNIRAIDAGTYHSLALRTDGTVVVWGWNDHGQANFPAGLANVTAIAAGNAHNLAIVTGDPPTIATQPASLIRVPGESASISVVATGIGPITFQWWLNGVAIAGATSATLNLTDVQTADAGRYSVAVTNRYGTTVSDPALLTGPNPPPTITVQPGALTARGGEDVSFSVGATATGTITYQWRLNGAAITGATGATLNLGPASLSQNGVAYDVVVYDGLSRTVSQPAGVSVVPAHYPEVLQPDPSFTPTFDILGGLFRKFVRTPDGRIYLAGVFSRIGGVPAWNLARLTAAGVADATFRAVNTDGPINTLDVQSDGRVVIGGAFNRIDGQPFAGLARLNTDGSLDRSFVPTESTFGTLAVKVLPDGRIMVGGGFTTGNGLIRVNADGSRDARFANNSVRGGFYDLALQADGKVVAGGSFSRAVGFGNARLARFLPDGSIDSTFATGAGPNSIVKVVRVLGDGRILIAGDFYSYNNVAAGRIVRLSTSGEVDPTWNAGTGFSPFSNDSGVESLVIMPDGRLLAIGGFHSYNGTSRLWLARLQADGALDVSFVPASLSGGFQALGLLNDGNVLVGGSTSAGNLNVLSPSGSLVVNPLTGTVFSHATWLELLPLPGGKYLAAGTYSHLNGVAQSGLARINTDGSVDPTFAASSAAVTGSVLGMMRQADGKLVIPGLRPAGENAAGPSLVRLHTDGAFDPSFQPSGAIGPATYVDSPFPLPRDRMLLQAHVASSADYFVILAANGAFELKFPAPVSNVNSLATAAVAEQEDGRLLVAGAFTKYQGASVGHLMRFLADGRRDPEFVGSADAAVHALALQPDGKIVIGGEFLAVNGTPMPRLARLNRDGSLDPGFRTGFGPDRAVKKLLRQADGRLIVSGWFTAIDGTPATAFIARLLADGTNDPTFAAWRVNGSPASLAMQDDGNLVLFGRYNELGSYLHSGVVRLVSSPGPVIAAQPRNTTLLAGQPLTLTATVLGAPAASYRWRKDGQPVAGATAPVLTLAAAQAEDSGNYTLQVTVGATVVTSNAASVAITASAPVFADSPAFISGFSGAIGLNSRWPLTAPALTAGSAPLAYQWYKDGAAIAGATGTSWFPPWGLADAGVYRVTIANPLGTIASEAFQQLVTGTRDWLWNHPIPQGNGLSTVVRVNGRFLAGGFRGTILTSLDGNAWTVRRLGVSEAVTGFAYGNGNYVALADFGGLWHSSDTVTWTRRNSPVAADGRRFAAAAFGAGRFVAVGSGGLVATSTDGITWTAVEVGTTDDLSAVAFGAGRFLALGSDGRSFASSNGVTWTASTKFPRTASAVASGSGRLVVAVGATGYTSVDGASWSECAIAAGTDVRRLEFNDGLFLALLRDPDWTGLATSADGLTWTQRTFGSVSNGTLGNPEAFAYGGDRYVVVSMEPDFMFTSADGLLWSRPGIAGSRDFAMTSIAAGGGRIMAGGVSLRDFTGSLWSSTDGAQWTVSDASVTNGVFDVAYGNGRFVAVGALGRIKVRPDNSDWAYVTSGTTESLYGVAYVNDRFVALGGNGTLLTSTDGTAWTAAVSGTIRSLYNAAFGSGIYIAVGAAGTVLRSTNAVNWTADSVAGIGSNIGGIAYGNGGFVLVSEGGSIRTSPDGIAWTARINPLPSGLNKVIFAGGRFFAFTTGNTNYLTSPDGAVWTAAQHGSASVNVAPAVLGDRLYLAGANGSIVSLPLNAEAPAVISPPVAQTVPLAGTATFTIGATGTAPLAYQWFKDGTAITGATGATLILSAVSTADAGSYAAMISNEAGSLLSGPSVLAVPSTPQAISFAELTNLAYGDPSPALSATASSGLPVTYTVVSGPATLAGNTLTLTGAGLVTIVASQVGNSAYVAATPVTRSFRVLANHASWRVEKFTSGELANDAVSGPGAIFGLDGLPNLTKYALGLEPKTNITSGLPEVTVVGGDWAYSYSRPESVTDMTYEVEVSTNLSAWSTAGVTHELVSASGGTATWRGRYPLASAANVFFRLKTTSTATTHAPPLGGMTLMVPAGQTRSVALPLPHYPVGAGAILGRISDVGTNYIDAAGAGWTPGGLSAATNPYYLRVRTGASAGRVLPVTTTANTDSRVYVNMDNMALTTSGVALGSTSGDAYELVLADTLGSLFGSSLLQGAATATAADNVYVWGGASWLIFYRNTTRNRWERDVDTAASPSRDNYVLRPDRGIFITRRASTELRMYVTGRVPEFAPKYFHARPGVTFITTGVPVDTTLANLGLQVRASGWQNGLSATTATSDADVIYVWGGASWLIFYFDAGTGHWQRVNDLTNRDTYVISAGRPIMVRRLATGTDTLIALPLPYTVGQ